MPRVNLKQRSGKEKTIDECFREFILNCRVKNLSRATMKYYEDSYYYFKNYMAHDWNDSPQSITKSLIQEYTLYLINETDNNERSVKTRISGLRTFIYYMMEEDLIGNFKIQIPKVHQREKETYSDTEIKRLLAKPDIKRVDFAEYRSWVIVNVLLGTGCRSSNIRTMQIGD